MGSTLGRNGAARRILVVTAAASLLGHAVAIAAPSVSDGAASAQAQVLSDSAAREFGLPAAGAREQWVGVAEEVRADTSFDPKLGRSITTTGTYREFVLAPHGVEAMSAQAVAAAGCSVNTYHSGPHRVYYSHAYKYGPRSYAWAQMSSGCTYMTSVSVRIREDHGIYTPTVARGSAKAYPGEGRRTAYAYYSGLGKCETYWSTAFGWNSKKVRVCP